MSRNTFSIGQRSIKHNSLFAMAAAAITFTLTAAPAYAQTRDLERVEVSGRVVNAPARFDVSASCNVSDARLQDELHRAWWKTQQYGEVNVQFVTQDGEVTGVRTRGGAMTMAQAVRKVVRQLDCGNAGAGTYVYRMQVVFLDPDARPGTTVAGGPSDGVYRIALAAKR